MIKLVKTMIPVAAKEFDSETVVKPGLPTKMHEFELSEFISFELHQYQENQTLDGISMDFGSYTMDIQKYLSSLPS